MLSRQAIFNAYFSGPEAVISVIEQHLGEEVLAPPPSMLTLQHTVQGQLDEIKKLKRQINNLREQVSQLRHQNFRLSRRISELEGQTALPLKDSHNSSLPPSTDPPTAKRTRSLRRPSGRPVGGQAGHPGRTRRLVEQPDRIICHRVEQCRRCQSALEDAEVVSTRRRQLIDLPEVKLKVTEHRVEVRRCLSCGRINKASFPEHVPAPLQYGPRMKARAVYLPEYQLLPYGRARELIEDWFGYRLSAATLAGFLRECSTKLVRSEAQIKARLKRAPVIHPELDVMMQLSTVYCGWCNYYRYANNASRVFGTLSREVWWSYAHFLGRKQKSSIKQMIIRERKAGRLGSVQRGKRNRNTFSLPVGKKRWVLNLFPPKRVSIRTVTGKQKWEVDLEPFEPLNWQSGRSYATRLEAMERACGVCERCKGRPVTQVHHKVRLRGRSLQGRINSDRNQRYEAIALCDECHLEIHGGNFRPGRKRSVQSAEIR